MGSIKIQNFFNGRFFEVPKYQRGYAWEKVNVRELFDDIHESINSKSNHYIGTVVLSNASGSDEVFYIVDGQQRITTLTMIINALIEKLSLSDASYFQRFYIRDDEKYRLLPLSRDQDFFTNLLEGSIGEPQNKSQRFLANAMEEIRVKISLIPDKLAFLKAVEKLELMEFVEDTEGDAIRIFQTVNDRGKSLSNMEKAKSLLIYFSNRYLRKSLDNRINDAFSDIFEFYDDIKHTGEELGVGLIKARDFTEDNLMRYHFITFSDEDYDPSPYVVLEYLKRRLVHCRTEFDTGGEQQMHDIITSYISSLRSFFESCKDLVQKATVNPKYYKLFVILNLSATLYPLIARLNIEHLLEQSLTTRIGVFIDLIELIDVRVYKTRGTDPKRDIGWMCLNMGQKSSLQVEEWLIWFNANWMPKEQFSSLLSGNFYGNRALNHIFIDYCEHLNSRKYTLSELKDITQRNPNIEHVLSQTPNFDPVAFGFRDKQDYIQHEHRLGNLTLLEKSFNSSLQNAAAIEKVSHYDRSFFQVTKKLATEISFWKIFTKKEILSRTQELALYFNSRWWC